MQLSLPQMEAAFDLKNTQIRVSSQKTGNFVQSIEMDLAVRSSQIMNRANRQLLGHFGHSFE
jgi:hypothetical protein